MTRRGREVRLVGLNSLPIWEDEIGRTWGRETYRKMRRRGFNVVRFPIHWSAMEPARGRFDATNMATLDRAVRYASAAGLYVVLDPVHIWNGEQYVPAWARRGNVIADVEANAAPYLRMLAHRYRRNTAVAAIDMVSEPPMDPPDQNRVLRMYSRLIRAVRPAARRTILMFNCVGGDTSMKRANLRLLHRRRNLVFTMYDYYAGGPGDGYNRRGGQDTVVHGGNGYFTYDEVTGYPVPNRASLERHLRVNLRRMRRVGIPVWIGAFGINTSAVNADRWIRDKVALYRKYHLGYAWWLNGTDNGFATMTPDGKFRAFIEELV